MAVPSTSKLSERDAAILLSLVPGIGPKTYSELLAKFSSPTSILAATKEQLTTVPGIGNKLANDISQASKSVDLSSVLETCKQNEIQLITRDASTYPAPLLETFNPPSVLYCHGNLTPADGIAIAIVGTRHATTYGLKTAERLARGLSLAGFTIVSGMARGIDAAAHRGALEAGGRTIAVLGSGLLNIYPPEHKELASEIQHQGAVISELPPLQKPRAGSFPQRNRIVTGLSLGTIVVEAAQRSGALISARLANEQGREVFAVPGRIDNRMSRGCHGLIRDGAKLVESVDDVLDELGPLAQPRQISQTETIRHPAELKLTEQEKTVLNAIEIEPTEIDTIIAATGLPVSRVLSTLSVLEIRHLVRRVSGTKLVRV